MDGTLFRRVYIVLGIGAMAAFFGHAMWAVRGKDSFIELVTGSFDHVLGVSVGTGTAETIVNVIGWVDVGLSILIALALVGFILRTGALYRFAGSQVAIGLYAWAMIWGFATAAARMTGAGVFYPEVWDLVERGPNFLLPAAMILMTLKLRAAQKEEVTAPAPTARRGTLVPSS